MLYPIAIIQKNGVYHGHLPDMPKLDIEGDSMSNVIAHARQTVLTYLRELAENDAAFPSQSDISTHLGTPEYAGWTWAIVNIDASRVLGEAVDVNVRVPERLMQKINDHIKAQNLELNQFILHAVKQVIENENT